MSKEHLPDPVDQAAELEVAQREQGLDHVRRSLVPERHPNFDGENCIDCGDSLPKLRLEMGRIRCTFCQEEIERRR